MALDFLSRHRKSADDDFDERVWNAFVEDLALVLTSLQNKSASFDEARDALIEVTLFRVNELVLPAYERARAYQEGGFLTAPIADNSELTFAVGGSALQIHPDSRDLFRPSPFVALTRASTYTDIAIARADGYDAETGGLALTIFAVSGDPGPHADIIVSAVAGSVQAQQIFLTETQTARDKAADWAEKAVDAAVESGKFSAKHHATKSAASASAAATAAGTATAQAGIAGARADDAAIAATAAGTARDKAQSWAMANEDIPVEPDGYSAKHYADKAKHFAEQAQTFDPNSFYQKGQTYTRAEVEAIVSAAIDALVADAPGALDTLIELSQALGNDPNFAATITTALAGKAASVHTHLASQISDASATGQSLVKAANSAAVLSLLGVGSMATRAFTISTSSPSGGSNGDVWAVI